MLVYLFLSLQSWQSFVFPVLFKGRKKTLEQSDLYRPLKEHKSGKWQTTMMRMSMLLLQWDKILLRIKHLLKWHVLIVPKCVDQNENSNDEILNS